MLHLQKVHEDSRELDAAPQDLQTGQRVHLSDELVVCEAGQTEEAGSGRVGAQLHDQVQEAQRRRDREAGYGLRVEVPGPDGSRCHHLSRGPEEKINYLKVAWSISVMMPVVLYDAALCVSVLTSSAVILSQKRNI